MDRFEICRLLEVAAAEEILAGYQYQVVSPYLVGVERDAISEFLELTAKDEVDDHFRKLQARMSELGYIPRSLFDFSQLQVLSECKYVLVSSLSDLAGLMAKYVESEDCAIRRYEELARMCGDDDVVTRRLCEEIAADEWEHRDGFASFLSDLTSV